MSLSKEFNCFTNGKTWQDKVLAADAIWPQVKAILAQQNIALPKTPRRPDIRLICENLTGTELHFKNPGDHSGGKEECIPASGDSKAVMIMVKGLTLSEQYKNADTLFKKYALGTKGFSLAFLDDLKNGKLSDVIDEAYGPAPFTGQASKLTTVMWEKEDGTTDTIVPKQDTAAAFGARAATDETVFLVEFPLHIKGTSTTAELVESDGMAIAVNADWTTGKETTRPIVPSVAAVYYGLHFANLPVVTMDADGTVWEVKIPKPGTAQQAPKTHVPK